MDDLTPIKSIWPNTRDAASQAAVAAANIEPIAAAQQEDLIASDDELVEDFRQPAPDRRHKNLCNICHTMIKCKGVLPKLVFLV